MHTLIVQTRAEYYQRALSSFTSMELAARRERKEDPSTSSGKIFTHNVRLPRALLKLHYYLTVQVSKAGIVAIENSHIECVHAHLWPALGGSIFKTFMVIVLL